MEIFKRIEDWYYNRRAKQHETLKAKVRLIQIETNLARIQKQEKEFKRLNKQLYKLTKQLYKGMKIC